MDFHISTYDTTGLGTSRYEEDPPLDVLYYPGVAHTFCPITGEDAKGYVVGELFDKADDKHLWYLKNTSDPSYSAGTIPVYTNPTGGYIVHYIFGIKGYTNSPYIEFKWSGLTPNLRTQWFSNGWTTGTQATFEEELCDYFYTVSQYASNRGSYPVSDNVNLYLVRIHLTDEDKYLDIPFFQVGNDPGSQRVYTASIIT